MGSVAHGTLLEAQQLDVAVHLPRKAFLEKDYLNGKYLGRRAAYLQHLGAVLRKTKHGSFRQQSWACLDNDARWVPGSETLNVSYTLRHGAGQQHRQGPQQNPVLVSKQKLDPCSRLGALRRCCQMLLQAELRFRLPWMRPHNGRTPH